VGAAHGGLVEVVFSVLSPSVSLTVEVVVKALPAFFGLPLWKVFEHRGHLVLVGLGDQEHAGIPDILLELDFFFLLV
jgi:hypothetical protein